MSERPLICCVESVRAFLAGRKTQTRRVIKPQPTKIIPPKTILERCPYGKVGDLLWVRETYARWSNDFSNIIYQDNPEFAGLGKQNVVLNKLRASEKTTNKMECVGFWQKVPAIFMPKCAARIWLQITNIRVERLQGITEEDAIAEGMKAISEQARSYIAQYAILWNKLNAKRGWPWEKNPWVWMIEMKKLKGKIE